MSSSGSSTHSYDHQEILACYSNHRRRIDFDFRSTATYADAGASHSNAYACATDFDSSAATRHADADASHDNTAAGQPNRCRPTD
jgi:hypothetical protein